VPALCSLWLLSIQVGVDWYCLQNNITLHFNRGSSVHTSQRVCRNRYQAWQDTVRGLQKIVRDDVETNIQVLDAGEVRPAACACWVKCCGHYWMVLCNRSACWSVQWISGEVWFRAAMVFLLQMFTSASMPSPCLYTPYLKA